MKTRLTVSESAKLIELGVSPERASESKYNRYYRRYFPIFNLADILDILPKELKINKTGYTNLVFYWNNRGKFWGAYYDNDSEIETAPELIDALHSLLVRCLEKGYVKLN